MRKPIHLLTVLAVAAALSAAGCGDDEETSAGATGATGASDAAAIPLDEWVAQADDICASGTETIDDEAAAEFPGGQPDEQEATQFTEDTLIPSLQQQHDEIAALPPPEGNEGDVETLLTALEQGIAALEADPAAALSAQGSDSPFAEANQFADKLGLSECGES